MNPYNLSDLENPESPLDIERVKATVRERDAMQGLMRFALGRNTELRERCRALEDGVLARKLAAALAREEELKKLLDSKARI